MAYFAGCFSNSFINWDSLESQLMKVSICNNECLKLDIMKEVTRQIIWIWYIYNIKFSDWDCNKKLYKKLYFVIWSFKFHVYLKNFCTHTHCMMIENKTVYEKKLRKKHLKLNCYFSFSKQGKSGNCQFLLLLGKINMIQNYPFSVKWNHSNIS